MRIVNWNELAEEQRRQLLTRPAMTGAADITSTVSDIINRIRREGDRRSRSTRPPLIGLPMATSC